MIDNQLRKVAQKVFWGWVLASYSAADRRQMVKSILTEKDAIIASGMPLANMQLISVEQFKAKLSFDWFVRDAPQTIKIAKDSGIPLRDIYELYIIGSANFLLNQVYGESTTFNHVNFTEEKQLEICWQFVIGMISSSLTKNFKETMLNKEKLAVSLAQKRGLSQDEIIKLIIESNNEAMDFSQFKKDLPSVLKVFQLGGIENEQKIFEDFKILLAYLFYQFATKQ
ncbi:MAG: hypothetical protein ACOYMB_05275 [Patescibacteria group bacterium]